MGEEGVEEEKEEGKERQEFVEPPSASKTLWFSARRMQVCKDAGMYSTRTSSTILHKSVELSTSDFMLSLSYTFLSCL